MQVDWLQLLGRLHPLVLHLPIGLVTGWAGLEVLGLLRRKPPPREARALVAWLAALSAAVSAASGYALSLEGERGGATLNNHMLLGFAFAGGTLLCAVLGHFERLRKVYGGMLALTVLVMMPTGHLGASMTHGPDFLFEPFDSSRATPSASRPAGSATSAAALDPSTETPPAGARSPDGVHDSVSYESVAAIFAKRCSSCHGENRRRGGLALHEPELIRKGGDDGPVIAAGKPGESELLRRLRLPLDDDEHMPPESRGQPGEEELRTIEAWIASGAPLPDGGSAEPIAKRSEDEAGGNLSLIPEEVLGAPTDAEGSPAAEAQAAPSETVSHDGEAVAGAPARAESDPADYSALPEPDGAALALLESRLIHVEWMDPGSRALAVDFGPAAKSIGADEIAGLLAPLRDNVVQLSLARIKADDATIEHLPVMANLHRLDLRGSAVSDAAVPHLARFSGLRELVLSQTAVSDAAVAALPSLAGLRRLYVWKSAMTSEGVALLRALRSDLHVDAGDVPDAAAAEVEPELKFSSDAPPPGAAPDAAAIKPVNGCCPVTGKPLDPRYSIVFEGRVIGFCCPNCVMQFWADPEKYRAKIR